MSGDDAFLSRWSRRKLDAKAGRPPAPEPEPLPVRPLPAQENAAVAAPAPAVAPVAPAEPLPPVESLTPESDFAPFMRANVAPALQNKALRTLFRDPHFNVMDGLDTYIADYSIADPLPPDWLEKLNQMSHMGDVAKVPEEEAEGEPEAAEGIPGTVNESLQKTSEVTADQGLGSNRTQDVSVTIDTTDKRPPVSN